MRIQSHILNAPSEERFNCSVWVGAVDMHHQSWIQGLSEIISKQDIFPLKAYLPNYSNNVIHDGMYAMPDHRTCHSFIPRFDVRDAHYHIDIKACIKSLYQSMTRRPKTIFGRRIRQHLARLIPKYCSGKMMLIGSSHAHAIYTNSSEPPLYAERSANRTYMYMRDIHRYRWVKSLYKSLYKKDLTQTGCAADGIPIVGVYQ